MKTLTGIVSYVMTFVLISALCVIGVLSAAVFLAAMPFLMVGLGIIDLLDRFERRQ